MAQIRTGSLQCVDLATTYSPADDFFAWDKLFQVNTVFIFKQLYLLYTFLQ